MKDLLKYGLLAAGGFYLYRQYQATDAAVPGTTAPPAGQTPSTHQTPGDQAPAGQAPAGGRGTRDNDRTSAPPTSTPPAPNQMTLDIAGLVAAEASKNGFRAGSLLNFDEWNYYYSIVRGAPGPDFNLAVKDNRPRSFKMTVAEWYSLAAPFGVK